MKTKSRKSFTLMELPVVIASIAILAAVTSSAIAAPDKPNVILILGDDMGIDSVSAFNAKMGLKTPAIDQLTGCKQLPKQTVDGRSLVPLIHGNTKTLGRPFLAWWYPHAGHGAQPCQAILKDGWKLVHWVNQNETELYRLADDVGERNNLAKKEPKKTRELLQTLNQWVKETARK